MRRAWHVQGQYGYWVVQETRPEEGTRGVYNQISPIPTKKLATLIAGELNKAYRYGREDQAAEKFVLEYEPPPEHCTNPHHPRTPHTHDHPDNYEGQYGPDHDGGV